MKILKQTGTVDDYVTTFEILEKDTDYDETGLISAYKSGLKDVLYDAIAKFEQMPETLVRWKEVSIRLDRQWRSRQLGKQHSYSPYLQEKAKAKPTSTYTPRPAKDPDAMDIDTDWTKKIKCYTCNNLGHYACDCPKGISMSTKAKLLSKGQVVKTINTSELTNEDFELIKGIQT
jgi:hypothetical protein